MVKIVFITLILLSSCVIYSCSSNAYQPPLKNTPRPDWLGSEFNEVMMIDDENTAEQDGFYLINQPLPFSKDVVPVFFISAHIPLDLFKNPDGFFPELDNFILIIPDWELYSKVTADAQKNGIVLEPATSNFYYRFSRVDGKTEIDDYYISGDEHPQFGYKDTARPKGTLTVYRKEQYGSVCCPRDEKHILSAQNAAFINMYEKQNRVKIDGTFRETKGKEGEHIDYYTLSGLTANERLAFLLAKNKQWQIGGKGVFDPKEKRIICPTVMPMVKEGRSGLHSVDF